MKDASNDALELGTIFGVATLSCAAVLFALTFVPESKAEAAPDKPTEQLAAKQQAAPKLVVAEVKPALVEKKAEVKAKPLSVAEQMAAGKDLFAANCAACHRATGEGMPGMFPPLAKSDYLMADKKRAIGIVLTGLNGPIVVNGQKFNSMMPPIGAALSDEQVSSVLTYVRNSFGNKGEPVTAEEVAAARSPSGS